MKANTASACTLTPAQREFYRTEGYLIVRQLWTKAEIAAIKQVIDDLAAAGKPIPEYWEPKVNPDGSLDPDPLKRYPRMLHIHRHQPIGKDMMLDPRIGAIVRALLEDDEPIACQSMVYFKPPGSRGQALHQDNFYLMVKPGTCIAAWTAIDPALTENGGLSVVPGTHNLSIQCPQPADGKRSFVNNYVPPPDGRQPVPANLDPGDVLFFNGSVIHGSEPNTHPTLWRRSFIAHYMPSTAEEIVSWYFPLHDFNGRVIERKSSAMGGPCGEDYDWSKLEKFA
jgi:ectoine hydroxylase-related dioxygenase (phytanoyl-CoA dioxygenase family)